MPWAIKRQWGTLQGFPPHFLCLFQLSVTLGKQLTLRKKYTLPCFSLAFNMHTFPFRSVNFLAHFLSQWLCLGGFLDVSGVFQVYCGMFPFMTPTNSYSESTVCPLFSSSLLFTHQFFNPDLCLPSTSLSDLPFIPLYISQPTSV